MYTKCIPTKCTPHFDKLLYTFCIQNQKKFVEIWNTFCIHFVYISSDLQKLFIINIMQLYKLYPQLTVCRMDLLLISTYFVPFVVHFLVNSQLIFANNEDLKLADQSLEVPIKLMDYWIIHWIKLPVIKLRKSKSPYVSRKTRQICAAAGQLAFGCCSNGLPDWMNRSTLLVPPRNQFPPFICACVTVFSSHIFNFVVPAADQIFLTKMVA